MRHALRRITALALAGGLALAATGASAHAHLVSATPTANATVAAPQAIALKFSEKLEPKFSGVELMKANGDAIPVTSAVSPKDRTSMSATVKDKLAPGAYMVMWHVVSADGHRMKGDFNFTVK